MNAFNLNSMSHNKENQQIGHSRHNTTVIGPISKAVQVKGPSINDQHNKNNKRLNRNPIKGIYSFPLTKNIFQSKPNYSYIEDDIADEMPSGKKIFPIGNFSHETNFSTNSQNASDDLLLECNETLSDFKNIDITETLPSYNQHQDSINPIDVDTFNYLVCSETHYSADAYYLSKMQQNITKNMRAILLNWLVEICADYFLHRETFYLAALYLDRYLSKVQNVPRNDLQLIGAVSLHIASKMEERIPLHSLILCELMEFVYSEDQFLNMEVSFVKVIQ